MINSDGTNKHWDVSDVKQIIDELGEEYNYNNLIDCLFYCAYIDMGYIDPLKTEGAE